ncbi:hypothetical protein [Gilvimarinus chinensis]|uniref:hypothetical protein n=1 Tax=Gilvimarinus chinensis TaxID=396005 RepID=UPI000381CB91|nr:hypothetical protein [Gilvimarinus chinensis]
MNTVLQFPANTDGNEAAEHARDITEAKDEAEKARIIAELKEQYFDSLRLSLTKNPNFLYLISEEPDGYFVERLRTIAMYDKAEAGNLIAEEGEAQAEAFANELIQHGSESRILFWLAGVERGSDDAYQSAVFEAEKHLKELSK